MKKFAAVLGIILSYYTFAHGIETINYIKINNYTSPSINIVSIDDFLRLMKDNKTKDVFFTDSLFLIQGSSLVYIINNNGYKNLSDYKAGNDKKFINGESYYFALENNLPNQYEVEFYKKERFITNADYQEATRLGFTHSDVTKKGIYGLITKDDIQKNIQYLNIIYYLQSHEDKKALENTDFNFIISKFGNEQIKKLSSSNYYLINVPLNSDKDSLFYYMCKFCQYSNITEYKNNNSKFTLKGTEQILRRFSFNSLETFLDGDSKNVTNGNDYNLMVDYGQITLEQLNQNRILINELESIKQRYLQNIDLSKFARFSQYDYSYNSPKAKINGIIAFAIYSLLKQSKGIPVSYTNFVANVQKEYSNNNIYRKISFEQGIIPMIFENIPQLKNMFVVSTDSFYLK
jgi:hypothetical protein